MDKAEKKDNYKQSFLERVSKLDRNELQKILHANTKPPKKIKVWSLVEGFNYDWTRKRSYY